MDIREMAEEVKYYVSISDVLDYFGIPYKHSGRRVVFSLRAEREPSCSAILDGSFWAWKDFGEPDLRGSVIDLYNYLKNGDCSFSADVVKEMYETFLGNSPVLVKKSSPSIQNTKQNKMPVEVMSNFLNSHIKYLKKRGVYPVPSSDLKPVKYLLRNRVFYGLGIQTISGSWVIRQTLDKSSIRYLFVGNSDISFWKGNNNNLIIVEGMFDALSVRKLEKEKNNILILNSTSNVNKALKFIQDKKFEKIILALDNDKAGFQATLKIFQSLQEQVRNIEIFEYEGKDLNDYLILLAKNKITDNNKEKEKSIKATLEQKFIINALKHYDKVKVLAYAGTGKTTTLRLLTEKYPDFKFLYLAFNKSISEEAKSKFPTNTEIRTTHSLAYNYVVKELEYPKITNYNPIDIKNILEIEGQYSDYIAKLVKELFDLYCFSSEKTISEDFISISILKDSNLSFFYNLIPTKSVIIERLTNYVKELWQKMEEGSIPISHNFYLKYFELNIDRYKQYLNYDVVLLDEAQDTNDVTLSIFEKIPSKKKIIVGDIYQKIYGFRKAIDAMEKWKSDINLRLTISFRFNEKIAEEANKILLNFRKEKVPLKAFTTDEDNCEIKDTAFISRTNANLLEVARDLIYTGKRFKTIREPYEMFKLPLNIYWFSLYKSGHLDKSAVKEKRLLNFDSIEEMEKYADAMRDIELQTAIKVYQKYKSEIEDIYNDVVNINNKSKDANIVLTTAHSSKGLEWDKVIILDDFPDWAFLFAKEGIKSIEDFIEKIKKKKQKALEVMEEINLFYVAITRAKKQLEINSINKDYYDNLSNFKEAIEKKLKEKEKEKETKSP